MFWPVVLSLALILLISACFAWVSWRVLLRWGVWPVALTSVICAITMTKVMQWRVSAQQVRLGVDTTAVHRYDGMVFQWLLPFWMVGLGAVSWFVWERRRAGVREFSWRIARQSVAIFAIGALAYVIVFAVLDITGMLS